jgi:cobalt-zinc-cadmium efflux system protein
MSNVHNHDGGAAHGHAHAHPAPANFGAAFAIGIGLNLAYVLVEFGIGAAIGSLALMADAGHNLSDVLGLAAAWAAAAAGKLKPNSRYTFGFGQASILAALLNAILLMIACGAIGWEAIQRFGETKDVPPLPMMAVAAVGVVINTITALLFFRGRNADINVRGAFLHLAADALVSLGVILAGLAILVTGLHWIDPLTSLVIVAVIIIGTWGLLRDSVRLSMKAAPNTVATEAVRAWLLERSGVTAVHDLHVWSLSTTQAAVSAHLVIPQGHPGDALLAEWVHGLKHDFPIHHVTLQIEIGAGPPCDQAEHA